MPANPFLGIGYPGYGIQRGWCFSQHTLDQGSSGSRCRTEGIDIHVIENTMQCLQSLTPPPLKPPQTSTKLVVFLKSISVINSQCVIKNEQRVGSAINFNLLNIWDYDDFILSLCV